MVAMAMEIYNYDVMTDVTVLVSGLQEARDVCAIFFVTFLNNINSGPQNRIPLRTFRHTAQNNLRDEWEFYMKRTEIYKFALKKTEGSQNNLEC